MFLSRRTIERGDGGHCSQGGTGRVQPLNVALFARFDPINYIFVFVLPQLDNDITMVPAIPTALEQVVEFSILLNGEIYSDNLDDPSSLQFQMLSRQLGEKVCHVSLSRPLCLRLCLFSLSHTHMRTHAHTHVCCTNLIHLHLFNIVPKMRG